MRKASYTAVLTVFWTLLLVTLYRILSAETAQERMFIIVLISIVLALVTEVLLSSRSRD
jgi:hypothetical protein